MFKSVALIVFLTFVANSQQKGKCPATDPADPIYLPHETDCGKYYECSGGSAILFICPPGLYFNTNKSVCDFARNVDCGKLKTSTAAPAVRRVLKQELNCPAVNGVDPVYIASDSNCEQFYECDSGWAILHTCPDHLMFNPKVNVCDFPENVDCKN